MENQILITGASSGLGRALVEALSGDGARVIAVARPSKRLEALKALPHVQIEPLDLGDTKNFEVWAKRVAQDHGPLKAIVHNAGIQHTRRFRTQRTLILCKRSP
ncbi:MAG: SDR family NAD(P)-dependent oxidoreductase [Rhodobacteraceae bacterium]|nr:SDR family NAD(P)-dependent oxidoreductase [Paracoccaceae bacterium]